MTRLALIFAAVFFTALPSSWAQYSSSSSSTRSPPLINLTPACPAGGTPGTLSFNGGGLVKATPDTATVSVTINGNASTAAEARRNAADAASSVLSNVTSVDGITSEDITTTGVSVYPKTRYNDNTKNSEPDGFKFENSIDVKVNNVTNDVLAEVLDTVVRAGGDLAQIDSVSLSLSDTLRRDLTNQARRRAVVEAQETANLYSEELAVTLGALLSFTDTSVTYDSMTTPTAKASYAISSAALSAPTDQSESNTPISLGSQSVSLSVNVIYGICTASRA